MDAMLSYEASRRPEIAELLSRVEKLTDREIQEANVPLPWFRTALMQRRDAAITAAIVEKLIVELPQDPLNLDTTIHGEAYRYNGEDLWVKLSKGSEMLTEIRGGTMVFIADDGRVWLGELFCAPMDSRIPPYLFPLGKMTRVEYKRTRNEEMNRNCPADAPILNLGSQPSHSSAASTLGDLGVTFR